VLSHFFLHENVSPYRWLGIILISCGVGWVTRGPEITERRTAEPPVLRETKEQHEIA